MIFQILKALLLLKIDHGIRHCDLKTAEYPDT
jgi:hypothetical protein